MTKHKSASAWLLCGLGAIIAPAIAPTMAKAQAATDEQAPAAAQDAETGSAQPTPGEIIVTALRQSQTVLKTPAAITAITGGDLLARGVNNLANLQNVAPSVNIASGRDGLQIAIRGVTTTDTSSKGEQDIAFSVDGVNVGRGKARAGAFFDVDRVEVLRGPQGTLYGRSATGGAVNVITNKPKLDELSGYLHAEYGNYDTKRAEGALNIPLGDTVAVRFSGAFNDRDGYSKPIDSSTTFGGTTYNVSANQAQARNDQKDAVGRASLLFEPGPDLTLRLTATVGHQGGAGSAPALETQLEAHNETGSPALSILANPVRAFLDNNFQQYDGSLNWKFGGLQLDLLGSYQHMHYVQQGPGVQDTGANGGGVTSTTFSFDAFGPTYQFFLQDDLYKTTQFEARISNALPGRVDFVAGANYFRESAGENGQNWNALLGNPLDSSTYIFNAGPVNTTVHKAVGLFGQATFHATDELSFVGGLRYTHDELDRVGTFGLPFDFSAMPPTPYGDAVTGAAVCSYPHVCDGGPDSGSERDNKVTWRIGANWQLTPNDLFYGSIATGFKAGGFNDYDPATGGIGPYKPESLTAYEIGYKGRPLPGVTFASSLFYYDFSSMQINGGVYEPTVLPVFVVYTLSTPTRLMGWENEASWQVDANTTLSGSLVWMHTKFRNLQTGEYALQGNPIDFSGKPIDRAPSFEAMLSASHTFQLKDDQALVLHVGSKYSSGYYLTDYADGVRFRQPHYTRSDASLTYEFGEQKYSVQLFVSNIENKVQRTSMLGYSTNSPNMPYGGDNFSIPANIPANYLAFYTTDPRFYGIRASVKF
ncbi:iron complex outermembrane receptor protein [Novosphingobium sp. PhB165]|uniref:TonB-dependent receptor n=1 Tax=Novosphingobium sp. PhB165 TaxID=2485105 RepID=UPI0010D6CD96|nr:TonB-dependent receptor [Novosphingobium sp. PhB165]TCM16583.1 iron complex outermembrane receptor protein [Novosphingobium sp. PhB165]